MSKSKGQPIENAAEIIDRFGGIRPMAKKIDVAVTTIQGWKKRDTIPAGRRKAVLEAAAIHDIDLSDLMDGVPPANENKNNAGDDAVSLTQKAPDEKPAVSNENTARPAAPAKTHGLPKDTDKQPESFSSAIDNLEEQLAAVEKKAITKSAWINIALLIIVAIAAVALLWPRSDVEVDRLSALEQEVNEIESEVAGVKDKQNFFGAIIPDNLDEQLSSLKEQTGQVVGRAKAVSNDMLNENASALSERVGKLEEHLQEMTGSPVLEGLLSRFDSMGDAPQGEEQLDQSVSELSAIVGNLGEGQMDMFESTLNAARSQSDALGQTFEGVPTTDLKAAAMLLGMTQFRSSLNRDNESFENDLKILKRLVGEDNPQLSNALDRLAPHAAEGVLTPGGLTNEFKTIAGDAVVASLAGEDVSVKDKAAARFNELFQVEKDGELITGTETQAKVVAAEKYLEDGDISQAVGLLQTLDGPAAAQLAPWIQKAQTTLLAQDIKGLVTQTINMKTFGSSGLTASGVPTGATLIRNEETGINILKPNRIDLPGMPKNGANPFTP